MKLQLGVLGVFVASCGLLALGACSDDTGTGTTSNTSSSSSSSSGEGTSSGMTSSSSSGSSGMTSSSSSSGSSGMTSSSSSSGSGAYTTCGECTHNTTGVWFKECKAQEAACSADPKCDELFDYYYSTCSTDEAGGCCTFAAITMFNTPQASQDKFFALDNCSYCGTCKSLCDPGATEYCKVTAAKGVGCP